MERKIEIKHFNLLQIILFHLLPGLFILLVAVICTNPVWGFGLPIFLSLMIGIIIGLLPVQWGNHVYFSQKAWSENKRFDSIYRKAASIPNAAFNNSMFYLYDGSDDRTSFVDNI